jgi:hypothetical protein
MFRTSYVHLQKDYIVHAALYVLFSMHLCEQFSMLKDVLDIPLRISDYRVQGIEYKVSSTSFDLLDCLQKCTENIIYKAACTK